jgi:glycine C-acetyltransferase
MSSRILVDLAKLMKVRDDEGLMKRERVISSAQGAEITVAGGKKVLNFCANNYLGLASHPEVLEAAAETLRTRGFGLSSVRFICGTQDIHRELERRTAEFLGTDDAILYSSCFDANGGVFQPFLDEECAIIADQLNHASIIDGVRLCKAQRHVYSHCHTGTGLRNFDGRELPGLEDILMLDSVRNARYRLVATDGVFSMNGDIAPLDAIVDMCDRHDALLMVDDSHGTGYIGRTGRGSLERHGVLGRADLVTTTFGKACGGASGGVTAGRKVLIEWLRQTSRPYIFSNTMAPPVVGGTLKVLDIIERSTELRDRVHENAAYFRNGIKKAGFSIIDGETAIVPILFGMYPNDAVLVQQFADDLLEEGIYAIGFFYPVVARGQSRIRVQLSAAHTREHLDMAIAAFEKVGKKHGITG